MFSYQFEIPTQRSVKQVKTAINQLEQAYTVSVLEDQVFIVEKQNTEKKLYFIPIEFEGKIKHDQEAGQQLIECQAKLTSSGIFRQFFTSILFVSFIMITWQQKSSAITAAQVFAAVIMVGSFLSVWRTVTKEANAFKKILKSKLT